MALSFFIARRYLFSKKSHNAINLISGIAVAGIAIATATMIATMSVFNGFRDLISSLYTAIDPELVVVPAQEKFADASDVALAKIRAHKAVAAAAATFEENALILFRGHPLVVKIKGVDSTYQNVTNISSILVGDSVRSHNFLLEAEGVHYGVLGEGLAQQIGSLNFGELQICAPRSGEQINIANPIESFSVENLHAPGYAFAVGQRKYDDHYILTSLTFATTLFEKEGQLSQLEIRLRKGENIDAAKRDLRALAGKKFNVLDRMEQQADVFNIMQVEKLMAYIFLTFIVLIACFNVISSLSMLIIEKRQDVETLRHLGMSNSRIKAIFMTEGRLIALFGAIVGLALGGALCWLQMEYGFITMGNGKSFIVRAYPVAIHWQDFAIVFLTVIVVGFLSVWYPVHALSRRLLQ